VKHNGSISYVNLQTMYIFSATFFLSKGFSATMFTKFSLKIACRFVLNMELGMCCVILFSK
jgi:hypothetical protein